MCEKTYIFGCGCKSCSYLPVLDYNDIERRYCAQHFNQDYAVSNPCNRRCQLTRVEGPCSGCGVLIKIESRHALSRDRLFLCRDCTTLRAKIKTQALQAQKSTQRALACKQPPNAATTNTADNHNTIWVTCPKCRRKRKMPAVNKFGSCAPKWQYCDHCRKVAQKYMDGDNTIFISDMIVMGGKQVLP